MWDFTASVNHFYASRHKYCGICATLQRRGLRMPYPDLRMQHPDLTLGHYDSGCRILI